MREITLLCFCFILGHKAFAQQHGNGLSKTTYAGSADGSFEALHWMITILNATPARDSSASNVQKCDQGSSGMDHDWLITMQRGETVLQNTAVGSCHLLHRHPDSLSKEPTLIEKSAALVPPSSPGDDCLYDFGSMFSEEEGGKPMVVNAQTADTCCKSCVAHPDCLAASFFPIPSDTQKKVPPEGNGGMGPQPGEAFGIHVTSIPGHSDWPGLAVEAMEQIFTDKVGDMTKFDWFMDYNVAFYTSDLDKYLDQLDNKGLLWYPSYWDVTLNNSTFRGYSCFVHVGHSQLIIELLSFNSKRLLSNQHSLNKLEPRMTETRAFMFLAEQPHDDIVVSSVSRAVSDLDTLKEVEKFYMKGAGAELTMKLDDHHYPASSSRVPLSKRCFQWPQTAADVCFTTYVYDDIENGINEVTSGTFTPKMFQDMLHTTHEYWLRDYPACANDRWLDNHYAVDIGNHSPDVVDSEDHIFRASKLLNYVLEEELLYTCGGGPKSKATDGAHYVVDPTGWAVQLDLTPGVAQTMPGCEEVHDGGDSIYHPGPSSWCDMGTCSAEGKPRPSIKDEDEAEEGEDGKTERTIASFPISVVVGLFGAVAAFCVGFLRGGGTPEALIMGKGEYELVSREVMLGGDDEDEDDEDDIGTEQI